MAARTRLRLRCEVVRFLDESGALRTIEEWARYYRNSESLPPTFHLPLCIDFQLLHDRSVFFAEWLIKEPQLLQLIFQEQIKISIESFTNGEFVIEVPQINSPIKLVAIPQGIQDLQFNTSYHKRGVKFISGVLSAISVEKKYISKSIWKCTECDDSFLTYLGLPLKTPKCSRSPHVMHEITEGREHKEEIVVSILDIGCLRTRDDTIKKIQHALNISLPDEMPFKLEMGKEYNFTVVVKKNKLTAWDVEEKIYRLSNPMSLPRRLQNIKSLLDCSPWRLSSFVALQLAKNRLPAGCYYNLRLGLLLSLASIQVEEETPPVSILALENHTSTSNILMESAARYADRAVFSYYSSAILNNVIKKDRQEAGSLILARNGVNLLGNWSMHVNSHKNTFIIKSAIDSGQINLDNGDKSPLQCSVWTYWDVDKSSKMQEQIEVMNNIFGMVFPVNNQQFVDDLADFFLEKAVNPNFVEKQCEDIEDMFTDNDLKDIFSLIKNWKVEVEESSEELLRNYFVAIRKHRPGYVPIRTLSILDSLSKAHARFSLRTKVLPQDVLSAIYLHQCSMNSIFGETGECIPFMKYTNSLNEIDFYMKEFGKYIQTYVNAHLSNTLSQVCM